MAEYIDREALLEFLDFDRLALKRYQTAEDIIQIIKIVPVLDEGPGKTGMWLKSDISCERYCCSICGGAAWYYNCSGDIAKSRYCPNCGAKMNNGYGGINNDHL